MAALTITIEPDEFLGLSALVELEKAANGGEADAAGTAKTLLRKQLAARLHELGLPWAPSQETVHRRVAEDAQPDGALRSLMRNSRVRKYAASVLTVAVLVALWGGYIRGWQRTGFPANNQLWDWLHLLLLPVIVGTIPLWIKHGSYVSRARRVTFVSTTVAFAVFVAAGYLIPLHWTGFPGNTLWNWFQLLLLPIAVAALGVWPAGRRSLRPYQKGVLALAALGWAITIIGGYALRWNWTGYQGNTLWDWLGLLLLPLVVPVVLLPATVTWISGDAAQRAEEAREVPEPRSQVSHRAVSRQAVPPRPPAGHSPR
jgi:hypothetical protein